jgi:hypothetical protein
MVWALVWNQWPLTVTLYDIPSCYPRDIWPYSQFLHWSFSRQPTYGARNFGVCEENVWISLPPFCVRATCRELWFKTRNVLYVWQSEISCFCLESNSGCLVCSRWFSNLKLALAVCSDLERKNKIFSLRKFMNAKQYVSPLCLDRCSYYICVEFVYNGYKYFCAEIIMKKTQ